MQEKILKNKCNGMRVLIITLLVLAAALAGVIAGGTISDSGNELGWVLFGISLPVLCLGWIPLMGLRVLKPQEALVLTLFGKYIGTIKGEGFYAVNPFCS